MTIKTALITGITGQDGALLARYLLEQDYKIIAPTRLNPDKSKLKTLNIGTHPDIEFIVYQKFCDFDAIIKQNLPDEIYHLAAMSHVGQSHQNPQQVFTVNTHWTTLLLQAVAQSSPQTKFFFASSCEIFASNISHRVTENSIKQPNNPYGISKLAAHLMVQYYRKVNSIFACNGILFNHESKIRDDSFVSKKICKEVARIVKHGGEPLFLGNIAAKKDWGYAADYVRIFHSMLQQNSADDYVIATGVLHSVKDMVNCAFAALDYTITWHGEGPDITATNAKGKVVVAINPKFFRPLDNRFLCGDSTKAQQTLGFNQITPFADWVQSMVLAEYQKPA